MIVLLVLMACQGTDTADTWDTGEPSEWCGPDGVIAEMALIHWDADDVSDAVADADGDLLEEAISAADAYCVTNFSPQALAEEGVRLQHPSVDAAHYGESMAVLDLDYDDDYALSDGLLFHCALCGYAPQEGELDPPQACEVLEVGHSGEDSPAVGDTWSVWPICDGDPVVGGAVVQVTPYDLASVADNVITWEQSGEAEVMVQAGPSRATLAVTVRP